MTQPFSPAVVQGSIVQPTATAGPVAAAVYDVAQILKEVVHNGRIFHSESQVIDAVTKIDNFVKAFVRPSEMAAVMTGAERGGLEDVSQRIPPNQGMAPGPVVNSVIDYDKLAAAIVRMQQQQATPPAPPVQETPAPNALQ